MSKHTPGPWEIDWYICREGEKELWRVPRSIGPAYTDHNHWAGSYITADKADAHLIAAAPDLLEALKSLVKVTSWICENSYGDDMDAAFQQARAAIAKAEGT